MKSEKKIEAGNEVNSRCLKCKDVTNHTIVAIADGKIAKVVCNVCGGRHNYRPDKPQTAAAAKRKTTRAATIASAKSAKIEAQYDDLLTGRDPSKALVYSMTDIFKEDDLLNHPVFGLGIITETVMPNKIEVLFREGSRLLVCGRLCR
ncbi:MAG: hypothetical protein M8357_06935 [Desulfobulbaceae bacterium]|nr:hypothetical protein [Desulfobulbaceae bacterium]